MPDRLRVVSNTGQNLRINVDTGATTTDALLNPPGSTVTAAGYTNSFAGAGTTTLYVLDVANDRLMIQGQPSGNPNNGDLQAVGPLGVDVQAATGFDISGINNAAFAAVTLAGASTSELHTLNLASGASARVNCHRRRRARARPGVEREPAGDATRRDDGQPSLDLQDHEPRERSTRTSR